MQIVLEVVRGPHRGQSYTFKGHENFIVGRARCAHFRLPGNDPYFSRVHFMVEINPPHCRLVDMGSKNGTMVNGRLVESADLRDGDVIKAGSTILKVRFRAEPDEARSGQSKAPVPPAPDDESSSSVESWGSGGSSLPEFSAPSVSSSSPVGDTSVEPLDAIPTIEGYKIVRELGSGGMGKVYLAARASDGAQVALKTIGSAVSALDREVQRFLREAEILRELRHPNIVAFHEMGVCDELLYFVMDYVPGTNAAELLRKQGPLQIGHAVRLVCDVLTALHYAHGRGFVHRDVKPGNVLIGPEQNSQICKLADFGLARVYHASSLSGLTIMGDAGGTVPYMPPDQIKHYRRVRPSADQYATAATLYRLLTGEYVFDLDFGDLTPVQHLRRQLKMILFEDPVPIRDRRSDVPDRLARAIHRSLKKEPDDRFGDAAAFRQALLPFCGDKIIAT